MAKLLLATDTQTPAPTPVPPQKQKEKNDVAKIHSSDAFWVRICQKKACLLAGIYGSTVYVNLFNLNFFHHNHMLLNILKF